MPPSQLVLNQAQLDAIVAQIDASGGVEICGLLAGAGEQVEMVLPVKNVSLRPAVHFEMDGPDFVQRFMTIEAQGWTLLAIYHSHPPGVALYPSETDVANAHYPDTAFAIAGREANGRVAMRAFHLTDGQVREIPVIVP